MSHSLSAEECRNYAHSSQREWLLTNGRGGFAMGTAAGVNTRRYHGLLVAAINPPTDRMVLLASLETYATVGGAAIGLSANQYQGAVHPQGWLRLESFRAGKFVEWIWRIGGTRIRRRMIMHPGVDAVTIEHTVFGSEPVQLSLRPLISHKFYHENFRVADFYPEFLMFPDDRTLIRHQNVQLTLEHPGAQRIPTTGWFYRFEHQLEKDRGLDPLDDLFCPCELITVLGDGQSFTMVAAAQEGVAPMTFPDEIGPIDLESRLVAAAEHFLVQSDERHSIIAGYPWFTDWGRDTMISLPGLCLETGRIAEARQILRDYAGQMKQGLLPNRFEDSGAEPHYHTVDATLWFANAIHATLQKEWDQAFAEEAMAWLEDVIDWHQRGTFFGIKVDEEDGLLHQGEDGVQLTWMDVKIGDWVVTPRHGKPIEINALWINLLRIACWICDRIDRDGLNFRLAAEKAEANFEAKFWHPILGHYLDTADPDDASLRPNQVLAMGLPYSPMDSDHARIALKKIREDLLTPCGLRTLGPQESAYQGRYDGDMAHRDAAYHQGTAWPWLIGSYIEAVLRLENDYAHARAVLQFAEVWLDECGIGGISEVYDGDAPHRPAGCPWQAWSVAETLRAWRLAWGSE